MIFFCLLLCSQIMTFTKDQQTYVMRTSKDERLGVPILTWYWGFFHLSTNPRENQPKVKIFLIWIHTCIFPHITGSGNVGLWHLPYNISDSQHHNSVLWVNCYGFTKVYSRMHMYLHGSILKANSCTWFRESICVCVCVCVCVLSCSVVSDSLWSHGP